MISRKEILLLVSLASIAMLPLSICQPAEPLNCPRLGFETGTMPMNGAGLEICSTTQPQCCSDDYITSVKIEANNTLREGLLQELNEISSLFSLTVERINNYFSSSFLMGWKFFLPNPHGFFNEQHLSESYDRLIGTFLNHLMINNTSRNFTTSEFVQNIIKTTTNSFANLLIGGRNTTIKNCIIEQLNNSVNDNVRSVMASHLETLRKGATSLTIFEQFFRNYNQSNSFEFPNNCVIQLVNISFCGRCKEEIPPLCSNTCGALIRGCYSPYYDALPNQFNILWNVSQQVLEVLNITLQRIFTEGQILFNDNLISPTELQACGSIGLPMQSMPNYTVQFISKERMLELKNMTGIGLSYGQGGSGPSICQPSSTEGQHCTNSCNINSFCTSSCRCFNGTILQQNTDAPGFYESSIEGQTNNKVINLTRADLIETLNRIKPVREFLDQQTIRSIIPEGVMIPNDDGEATSEPPSGRSGGVRPILSIIFLGFCVSLLILF